MVVQFVNNATRWTAVVYVHILSPVVPLEVGSSIWSTARVVILVKVGLEWRAVVVRFVAEGSTRIGNQISVILRDTLLLSPHAPADDGDASEKNGTAYASDDAANNLLFIVSETPIGTRAIVY